MRTCKCHLAWAPYKSISAPHVLKEGQPISMFFGGEESRRLAGMGLTMFLKMVSRETFKSDQLLIVTRHMK